MDYCEAVIRARIAVMSCSKCGLMKKTGCRIKSGMTNGKAEMTEKARDDRRVGQRRIW